MSRTSCSFGCITMYGEFWRTSLPPVWNLNKFNPGIESSQSPYIHLPQVSRFNTSDRLGVELGRTRLESKMCTVGIAVTAEALLYI